MSITSVVNDTVTSVSVLNAQKPLPPTITNYSVGGLDDTALDPAGGQTVQINGTGFLAGATITFDGSAVAIVTYVSPNQLTFTSPAKSAGTYTIYVVNPDGGTAIYIPGIIYSVLPTWTTGAGTLGSYYETQSISNTVVASGDAPITYSLYSGSLPTGSTLAANGVITGTAPVDSSSTTYSFTIEAIDAQLQGSTRSFSLTINTDVVTWVSPANATTYTSAVDSAIANVTLDATDAAGYAVTYSANALPTGLSLSGANISGTPTVIADSSTLLTATAATTNRTATRTINWSITVAGDSYFEYNTLLIPGASTTFVDDASTNNFAVTINGDTKPNSFNPYSPGYYSNYFDGSGDYLQLANAVSNQMGTGDWTAEAWVYLTSYTLLNPIFAKGGSTTDWFIGTYPSTGRLYIGVGNTDYFATTGPVVPLFTWCHVALVRNGSNQTTYLNGIVGNTRTTAANYVSTGALNIGRGRDSSSSYLSGYISNARLVKGTAVYTSNFTPSTTPLTAISGTSLLTCQSNRFIDTSTNNSTITVFGNTTVNSFDPFIPNTSYSTYGSGYFDGTGDYLTVPNNTSLGMGSGDFTVEFWVYQTSLVSYRQILDVVDGNSVGRLILWVDSAGTLYNLGQNGNARNTTAAGAITINTWIHVALVRSSGTTKFYINGTQSGSNYTDSTNYTCTTGSVYIGINSDGGTYPYQGYLTDFRMVKGTAVYTTAFTPPPAPLTAISGTSLLTLQNNQSVNNSTFLDNSTNNLLVTRSGNTTQGTFSPYGGNWSNYFDGTGDYCTFPNNTAFAFGTGAFTIEFWINSPLLNDKFILGGRAAIGTMLITTGGYSSTVGVLRFVGSSTIVSTNVVTDNTWHHCAIVRDGSNNVTLYVDGVSRGTGTDTTNYTATTGTWYMGTQDTGGGIGSTNMLTGYLSNFRIVKGTAVYTSTFTPPTTPLTPITNTSLLTCADSRFIDDSINNFTITKNGDTSVQRFSPFNPSSVTPTSYSGYFDGSGDYLTLPDNTAFDFPGDFTVEAWVYLNTVSGSQGVYSSIDNGADSWVGVLLSFSGTSFLATSYISGDDTITHQNTVSAGQWYHIAIVRSGSSTKSYLNGVQSTSTTSGTYSLTQSGGTIGSQYPGSGPLNGYISNLRVVKGTAVYTSTFTPPTAPLTAISGTSLLTCQSPTFIDNSTNNLTLTASGNSKPTIQNPFGYTSATTNGYTPSTIGGSGYFDGSGDYLTVPGNIAFALGTGSFTVEGWIYPTTAQGVTLVSSNYTYATADGNWSLYFSVGSASTIYFNAGNPGAANHGSSTTVTIPINAWTHIAYSRYGGNGYFYINGVQLGTAVADTSNYAGSSGLLYIGRQNDGNSQFVGYMSDFRIVKGTSLYTSNFVPSSAPLTAVQNTVLLTNMTSAGIYDASMMSNMETVADAKLSTAVSKFGGSSMYFDGTGDYLLSKSTPTTNLSTGDFTIEFWVYPQGSGYYPVMVWWGNSSNNGSAQVYCSYDSSTNAFYLLCGDNNGNWLVNVTGGSISPNAWQHIAIVRNGSSFTLYKNGVSTLTATSSGALVTDPITNYIGARVGNVQYLNGYIDDFRITKGYARYTSNFTPPASAFPVY